MTQDQVFAFFEENLHRMRTLLLDLIAHLPIESERLRLHRRALGPLTPYESA